jgi:hypothetical protein
MVEIAIETADDTFELENNPNYNFSHKMDSFIEDNEEFEFIDYQQNIISTTYVDEDDIHLKMNNLNGLLVLSTNIQCLNSKFSNLVNLIATLKSKNCMPYVICLQEVWKLDDPSIFFIDAYHLPLLKCRSNNQQGGGVGIYVISSLTFEIHTAPFLDRIFECIAVKISSDSNKPVIISSLYKPPNHPTLLGSEATNLFLEYLSNYLETFHNSNDVYIFGDTNFDMLELNSNPTIVELLNILTSFGFLQTIMKPTRISTTCAKIIDHVYTNSTNQNLSSYLLCTDLSDHLPILCRTGNSNSNISKKKVYTQTRKITEEAIHRFNTALLNYNWIEVSN